jgi:regulator of replication initiation timing
MDGIEAELDREELIALVMDLREVINELREENAALRKRVEELEGKNPTERLDESYSLRAEKRRQEQKQQKASGKKRIQNSERRGRRKTQEKIDEADRAEIVLPDGCDFNHCTFAYERPVWRIENGRTIRVTYQIYRGPGGQRANIEGVLPRSEFGIEIHISIAYLTFIVGLSIDKVCAQLKFFWNLDLSKSQADALLSQLSRQWENEFESLCELLAISAVVNTDETSWSINSVWAFLSEKVRILVFGCRKDGATLATLLDKKTFQGVLTSDDAAVYRGFTNAQKCWAHLIRKVIRLTFLEPENEEYRRFLVEILDVYRTAQKFAADKRLGVAGREQKVFLLMDKVGDMCGERFTDDSIPQTETEKDFRNLVHEIVRLQGAGELFTFVKFPEATGTNNTAEQALRQSAQDRKTCRTSKTLNGAKRRTILVSVFESLRLHVADFTLNGILKETTSWLETGQSLFDELLKNYGLSPPEKSILKKLIPTTS